LGSCGTNGCWLQGREQSRATIGAVEKDPSVIAIRKVGPEALAMVASNYRRADELPGMHSYDIYQDENATEIDLLQVSRAAVQADLRLRADMKKRRPRESVLEILAGLRPDVCGAG
jgi:hypothetical protein